MCVTVLFIVMIIITMVHVLTFLCNVGMQIMKKEQE